jgi:hypothetical protein
MYRRFGTSYRNHPQESSCPRPLKMGPLGCPETSVTNYQSTLRNIPEEWRSREGSSIFLNAGTHARLHGATSLMTVNVLSPPQEPQISFHFNFVLTLWTGNINRQLNSLKVIHPRCAFCECLLKQSYTNMCKYTCCARLCFSEYSKTI